MLLIFGLGYTGTAIADAAAAQGLAVAVTTRGTPAPRPGVEVIAFADAAEAVSRARSIVVTAPPSASEAGPVDPVLAAHGAAFAAAANLRWIGYLSTTGVYGDRGGNWVNEDSEPAPTQPRSIVRRAAELEWAAFADRQAVDLFRVAGIYGPGRSALDELRAGRARRVSQPGHLFGRIHRDDIAGAVLAAAMQDRPPGVRVLHLSDDEPAAAADVIACAAELLGMPPPPLRPLDLAQMGDMARSFWAENRKVASAKTQAMLARPWRFPSYREGLRAILDAGEQPAQHPLQ